MPLPKTHTTMPNRIADHRRKVAYIEEKETYAAIQQIAKQSGLSPSDIIRIATQQLMETHRKDPNARLIIPLHAR